MSDKKWTLKPIIGLLVIIVVMFFGQVALYNLYTKITPSKEFNISVLSNFYSIVFTIIAIIIGVVGIIGWRWIKEELSDMREEWSRKENEFNEKIEKLTKKELAFEENAAKVDFLIKKKELADWVQSKFERDADKSILTSISFDLTEEENAKLKEIEKKVLEDTTDDSWLKLVYAWQLLEEKQKNKPSKEDDFIKIESIYNYIEKRDLLKETSVIKQKLYHLQGLTYWFWYENKKAEFLKKYSDKNVEDIPWIVEWWKGDKGSKLLEKSEEYYRKTLGLCNKKEVENVDETQGNLVVVLIELSKFKGRKKERSDYLDMALKYLTEIKEKTFNTYWDQSRAEYYMAPQKNMIENANYKILIRKAAEKIETKKDKGFFIDKIEEEIKEIGLIYTKGFPGDEALIKEQKEKLEKKYLS